MNESPQVRSPRAYRVVDRALVAGVAAGVSAHSAFALWLIRVLLVVASLWKFSGAVAYAVLWLILVPEEKHQPIGLVAAERQGRRRIQHKTNWSRLVGWIGSCLIGLGVAWVIGLYDTSFIGRNSWAICWTGIGLGLVWLVHDTGWPRWGKALFSLVGLILAWTAGSFIQVQLWTGLTWNLARLSHPLLVTLVIAGSAMVGCGLIVLPWILHPGRSEEAKQTELIAETRADMAAHLHDSVLQTLAVIQKQAGDAKAVTKLARGQEKELREWLYGEHRDDESASRALKEVIAELEAVYPVAVELVTVGDHEMTVEIDAVVRAAREAILNAAKHSGAEKIDVYAEMTGNRAEAYVRDRGCGFKMDDVEADRMGIRRSIIDRMARYGGKVDIRSTPGEGTEIHLSMPLLAEGDET